MLNNKIKYILALFIILLLSMNAFSATNFTDDSSDATLQSSSSDKVVDAAADDGDDNQDNGETDNSDNTNTEDNKPKITFGGNGTDFDIASILDYFTKMRGGDNETNETVNPEVSVPKVVTSISYAPVSQSPTVEKQSSHVIQRLRDNKTINEGSALTLDNIKSKLNSQLMEIQILIHMRRMF